MDLCIPVLEDRGLDSRVSAHFGSAPIFMIVDTESGACRAIVNGDGHHEHGQCNPVAALAGMALDGVAVGGIGAGAVAKLEAADIPVFRSAGRTVAETVAAWKTGALPRVAPEGTCDHGGPGHTHH